MNSFIDDLKNAFNRPNNSLYKLIAINIIVYLATVIVYVISKHLLSNSIWETIYFNVAIPSDPIKFLYKPWTIITYMFAHDVEAIFHILFNMLGLYWYGQLIMEYLGSKKLLSIYVLGGLFGGVFFLLITNISPALMHHDIFMIGASAAVYAVVVGAATLLPDYTFFLLLIGPVRIKYVAAFYIVASFVGSVGGNAGGAIAHLGGALLGYIFITQLRRGNDLGKPVNALLDGISNLFKKRSKIKVTYNKGTYAKTTAKTKTSGTGYTKPNPANNPNYVDQDEIDAILDKISQSGYEKLTTEEKQKLFKASQRK